MKDEEKRKTQVSPKEIQNAEFQSFPNDLPINDKARNLNSLLNIPLQVTVQLGKSTMKIKDVLALGPGSMIELDKLAGEPVDILMNGVLMAKGEVVVVDEKFGVRVISILDKQKRLQSLQDF